MDDERGGRPRGPHAGGTPGAGAPSAAPGPQWDPIEPLGAGRFGTPVPAPAPTPGPVPIAEGGLVGHFRSLPDPWAGVRRPEPSRLGPADTLKLVLAGILVGLSFLVIFGGPIFEAIRVAVTDGEPVTSVEGSLAPLIITQLALFVVPPLAWAALAYPDTTASVRRRLLLNFDQWWKTLSVGAGAAVIFLIIMFLVLAAVHLLLPDGLPDNELAESLGKGLTPGLILLLAFGSAAGEEIFFRSFLQRRLGLIATSIVFGLVHLTYFNVLQVIIPAILGLLFGYLLLRYRTVLAPFAAHFTFNFLQLTLMYVADEGYTAWLPLPALLVALGLTG